MTTDEELQNMAEEVGIDNIADTIKIGSKEEAAWKIVEDNSEIAIADMKRKIELNVICLEYAKKRRAEEQQKFLEENKKE